MKISTLIVSILFSTVPAFASPLQGQWEGQGVVTHSETAKEPCNQVSFQMGPEGNTWRVKGTVLCENSKRIWDYRLIVDGEKLISDGVEVGKINDEELVFHLEGQDTTNWTVQMILTDGNTLKYNELFGFQGEWTILNAEVTRK